MSFRRFSNPLLVLMVGFLLTNQSDATEPLKVACVGDSITFGAGIKERETQCYPVQLGQLLGDEFEVRNFGVNGATLLKQGDLPYWNRPQFKMATEFQPSGRAGSLGLGLVRFGLVKQHEDGDISEAVQITAASILWFRYV